MHVGDFPEHEPEREKVNGHWCSCVGELSSVVT